VSKKILAINNLKQKKKPNGDNFLITGKNFFQASVNLKKFAFSEF